MRITKYITAILFCLTLTTQSSYAEDANSSHSTADQKVHNAIHKAAEIKKETKDKMAPMMHKASDYMHEASEKIGKMSDAVMKPINNAVDTMKDKMHLYGEYFKQEFGWKSDKPETAAQPQSPSNTDNGGGLGIEQFMNDLKKAMNPNTTTNGSDSGIGAGNSSGGSSTGGTYSTGGSSGGVRGSPASPAGAAGRGEQEYESNRNRQGGAQNGSNPPRSGKPQGNDDRGGGGQIHIFEPTGGGRGGNGEHGGGEHGGEHGGGSHGGGGGSHGGGHGGGGGEHGGGGHGGGGGEHGGGGGHGGGDD